MRILASIFFFAFMVAPVSSEIRIQYGPFNLLVPEDWHLSKVGDSKNVMGHSPYELGENKGGALGMSFRFEEKRKVGTTLEDLVEFLTEKLVDKPELGEAMIKKELTEMGVEWVPDFKISAPKIESFGDIRVATAVTDTAFPVDDLKVEILIRSYWVYASDKAYLLRIILPKKLKKEAAEDYRRIVDSLRIGKGEQDAALKKKP